MKGVALDHPRMIAGVEEPSFLSATLPGLNRRLAQISPTMAFSHTAFFAVFTLAVTSCAAMNTLYGLQVTPFFVRDMASGKRSGTGGCHVTVHPGLFEYDDGVGFDNGTWIFIFGDDTVVVYWLRRILITPGWTLGT